MEIPSTIAAQFVSLGPKHEIREFGSGNINRTFIVFPDAPGVRPFLLQRLNRAVFPQPHLVMQNLCAVSEHVQRRLQDDAISGGGAISMVDLDTVKPGLIQYDVGDCLRSCCNVMGEETSAWEEIYFDLDLAQSVMEGYFSVAKPFLTKADIDVFPDSIRLLAFELGVRFFTDHLGGDTYFKTTYHGHNLARALVQLKLAESIDQQMSAIRQVIQRL